MIRTLLVICFAGLSTFAGPPPGYYNTAQGKAGSELLEALHAIIRNHHVIPYASGSQFDSSDALRILDASPGDTNYVVQIYNGSNALASSFGSAVGWNREHLWPNSYGLDDVEPAYSDLFNLRACDANVNSSRGNKHFDTTTTNELGYAFPAHMEAPLCSTDMDSWEPHINETGDIARALFYMAVRYTGDAVNEPELKLTDNAGLISSTTNYMGRLSTLLIWNMQDPVDAAERIRNDLVYSYQTNRNPFVDHPEWVILIFAPAYTNQPTLNISRTVDGIALSWLATNQSTHLEFTTNLPATWLSVTSIPFFTNSQFRVLWTNITSRTYFRLRAQ